MLAAIGLILIIKQIPHATGYHTHFEGDESYMQETAQSSFYEFLHAFIGVTPGSVVISVVALLIMILWSTAWFKRTKMVNTDPRPLSGSPLGRWLQRDRPAIRAWLGSQ